MLRYTYTACLAGMPNVRELSLMAHTTEQTSCCRILFEKIIFSQQVNMPSAFRGIQRYTTVATTAGF
jgi:hypothetical protein